MTHEEGQEFAALTRRTENQTASLCAENILAVTLMAHL